MCELSNHRWTFSFARKGHVQLAVAFLFPRYTIPRLLLGIPSFTPVPLSVWPTVGWVRRSRCRSVDAVPLASGYRLLSCFLCCWQGIKRAYGDRSVKGSLASKALDVALAEAFGAMSTGAGRRLTSQLVVGPALAQTLAIGGRRLGASLFSPFFFQSFFAPFFCSSYFASFSLRFLTILPLYSCLPFSHAIPGSFPKGLGPHATLE